MKKCVKKSLCLATAAAVYALSVTAQAAEQAPCSINDARIHVIGQGEVKVMPDLVKLNYQVSALEKTPDAARKAVEATVHTFAKKVGKFKLADENAFVADDLTIVPRYDYSRDKKQELLGYEARRNIQINLTDFSLLSEINDVAMASGINQIAGFVYTVQDQKKYQKEAALKAIADAKEQAELLAAGFDVELGQACSLRFTNHGSVPYRNTMVRSYAAAAPSDAGYRTEATYTPETLVIQEGVEASFLITPKQK